MSNKPIIAAGLSFVITTGLVALLCANAHIDIFPCKETIREIRGGFGFGEGRLVTRDGTCSLMGHLRDKRITTDERERLTGAGWALLVLFCAGIGVADSALIYWMVKKAEQKKAGQSKSASA